MKHKSLFGIFVCCICEARWDYFDKEVARYFCFEHGSKDLPITVLTKGNAE